MMVMVQSQEVNNKVCVTRVIYDGDGAESGSEL